MAKTCVCGAKYNTPLPEGFVICPLCGDPERVEDIVSGVCLTCADGIAFAQNARRASIMVTPDNMSRFVAQGSTGVDDEC